MSEIKNDVIEKQYEELKNGIKFRIENNITDDWEQHYHCIDVLCEKHKERIKDIENGICVIEKLEKQLAKKDIEIERLKQDYDEVWEDTLFRVKEDFELNNNCNECRRYYAEEFNKQLSNAIIPKFKIGDKCWAIRNTSNIYNKPKQVLIKEIKITKNCIKYYAKNGCVTNLTNKTTMHLQSQLFATKEEAEEKLKEMMKSE